MLAPETKAPPAEQAAEPTAEDLATHDFITGFPMFKDKLKEMSKNQILRVINAVFEYPLQEAPFQFSYRSEIEAFNLGVAVSNAKFVLMKSVIEMSLEQKKSIMEEGKKNEEHNLDQ